jgi:hypothetical protein
MRESRYESSIPAISRPLPPPASKPHAHDSSRQPSFSALTRFGSPPTLRNREIAAEG